MDSKQLEMHHIDYSIDAYNKKIKSQGEKGMAKYGKPLDPLDDYDYLDMADDELVDGHQYIQAERRKRAFIVAKLRKLTSYKQTEITRMQINHWLDKLEGK